MDFKHRLRDLRRENKMSGEELGKLLGVKKTAVSYWENGRNYPNQETMQKLLDFFNVSYDYLMGNSDIRQSPTREDLLNNPDGSKSWIKEELEKANVDLSSPEAIDNFKKIIEMYKIMNKKGE